MIEAFLTDLKQNQQVMKLLGNPVNVIEEGLNEIAQLRSNQDKDHTILRLKDKDYDFFEVVEGEFRWKVPVGTVVANRLDGLISRPWRIKKVDDEIWVVSLYERVARFDLNFSFIGYFGEWGDFDNSYPNRYRHPKGIAVTEDRVFLAFDSQHRVGCYNRETGEKIWLFGDGTAGEPEDGRLYNPYDVEVLPNGNVLVACYYGQPEGAVSNEGFISEHNKENGSLVKVHFKYARDGYPWNGDVCRPKTIRMVQRPEDSKWELWVAYYNKNLIALFEYDETNDSFTYKISYSKTPGLNVGALYINDFVVDEEYKKIYLTVGGPNVVACLDVETHDLLGFIGHTRWEDYDNNPNTPGAFISPSGIEIINDKLLVADYTNDRIQQFPLNLISISQLVGIEYEGEIPDFKKIEFCSEKRFLLEKMLLEDMPQHLLGNPPPEQIIICGVL